MFWKKKKTEENMYEPVDEETRKFFSTIETPESLRHKRELRKFEMNAYLIREREKDERQEKIVWIIFWIILILISLAGAFLVPSVDYLDLIEY